LAKECDALEAEVARVEEDNDRWILEVQKLHDHFTLELQQAEDALLAEQADCDSVGTNFHITTVAFATAMAMIVVISVFFVGREKRLRAKGAQTVVPRVSQVSGSGGGATPPLGKPEADVVRYKDKEDEDSAMALQVILGGVQGESGWYEDPSSKMVAYFGIVKDDWVLEHGPFSEQELQTFLVQSKGAARPQGIPLPGTQDGEDGCYLTSDSIVTRYVVRASGTEWVTISRKYAASSNPLAAMGGAKKMKTAMRGLKLMRGSLGKYREHLHDAGNATDEGLVAILGTTQGEHGWYEDPTAKVVAYFCIVGAEWIMEHGPFALGEVQNLIAQAQHSPTLMPLPGTVEGGSGCYMDKLGTVQRFVVREGEWSAVPLHSARQKLRGAAFAIKIMRGKSGDSEAESGELKAMLDTTQGGTGWYKDPTSAPAMVAYFAVVGDDWVLVHGPFEEVELLNLVSSAKQSPHTVGVPLPGTAEGQSGLYVDGSGQVKRMALREGALIVVQELSSVGKKLKSAVNKTITTMRLLGGIFSISDGHQHDVSHVVEQEAHEKGKMVAIGLEKKRKAALRSEQRAYDQKVATITQHADEELSLREAQIKRKFNGGDRKEQEKEIDAARRENAEKMQEVLAEQSKVHALEVEHINEVIESEAGFNSTKTTRKKVVLSKELQELKDVHEKEQMKLEADMKLHERQMQDRLQARLEKRKKKLEHQSRCGKKNEEHHNYVGAVVVHVFL
jgi:hypothetical protein